MAKEKYLSAQCFKMLHILVCFLQASCPILHPRKLAKYIIALYISLVHIYKQDLKYTFTR